MKASLGKHLNSNGCKAMSLKRVTLLIGKTRSFIGEDHWTSFTSTTQIQKKSKYSKRTLSQLISKQVLTATSGSYVP